VAAALRRGGRRADPSTRPRCTRRRRGWKWSCSSDAVPYPCRARPLRPRGGQILRAWLMGETCTVTEPMTLRVALRQRGDAAHVRVEAERPVGWRRRPCSANPTSRPPSWRSWTSLPSVPSAGRRSSRHRAVRGAATCRCSRGGGARDRQRTLRPWCDGHRAPCGVYSVRRWRLVTSSTVDRRRAAPRRAPLRPLNVQICDPAGRRRPCRGTGPAALRVHAASR